MVHSVLRNWLSHYISPLATVVFWVFTFMFFLYFPLLKKGFLRFNYLCFEILLYILPALPLRGLGCLKELEVCLAYKYSRMNISRGGASVTPRKLNYLYRRLTKV